ncbi:hypothetical protein OH146_03165 [Salinibacterium sp. SYSU T00001]|uniref:hypothetical protein n=1 Tax=Homoserinimonas sedimenticola TaxID=2986805 RepID=UPI0022369471|nr:hypothetical protein [Salinibacterium sedimenticola]MCW4384769.1 hypothetical protein [Salinibacterium sedimenticola]
MNIVAFVLSFLIFAGGLVLMGYAPEIEGLELASFAAGILAVAVAIAIPVHVLKRADR